MEHRHATTRFRKVCSTRSLWTFVVVCLFLPGDIKAQQETPHKRRGLTVAFGIGPGSLKFGCTALLMGEPQNTPCGSAGRFFSSIAQFSVGWTISPSLILGLSIDGWNRPNLRIPESGSLHTISAQYYPGSASGFFLTAGVGVSRYRVGQRTFWETHKGSGPGAMAGIGFDIPMGATYSLVLQLRGMIGKQAKLGPSLIGPNGAVWLGPNRADVTQAVFGLSIGLRFH